MYTALLALVLVALVPHLILGGGGIDRLVVQMPAWHRLLSDRGAQLFTRGTPAWAATPAACT